MAVISKGLKRFRVRKKDSAAADLTSDKSHHGVVDLSRLSNRGHICCGKCNGFYFELFTDKINGKLTLGCWKCNAKIKALIPLKTDLTNLSNGYWSCIKHGKKMCVIKSNQYISFGCARCHSETIINVGFGDDLIIVD